MASSSVEFVLNGHAICASGFSARTTLLEFLRGRGLTGAKEGCAEGECGACTVALVRPRSGSNGGAHTEASAYVPVNSCLLWVPMMAGQEIYTVEALAGGGPLAPVQQAMAAAGGSQCGYCTPGFVMSLFAEHYRPGREGACDPHAMSGNLCRCTGYRPILDAALSLGAPPFGPLLARLDRPAPAVGPTHSEGFSRPATVASCLALLAEHPDARLLAGGTDLVVDSNLRLRRFPYLISVESIGELRQVREREDELEIGAAVTLSETGQAAGLPRVWQEWLPLFASPLIRNRATLGGNIATASPIGDGAPLLLALDALVRIAGPRGLRTVPLRDFFLGYRQTALAPGELLVSIIIPKPFPAIARFYKAAKRRMDDISTIAACFAIDLDAGGRVRRARLAFGGVAAVPLRATEAEEALLGAALSVTSTDGSIERASIERAQKILARTLHPISDHRGSAAYRLALAQSLLAKFWWEQREEAAA
jgi:xanthine dehydrogenase small subunit